MILAEIIRQINREASEEYAYSWDNTGLQVGGMTAPVRKILLCVDVTEAVMDEAVEKKCDLIISHHPLLFNPCKCIGDDAAGRIVKKAVKNDVNIYAAHTNFDISPKGMNQAFADEFMADRFDYLDDCADNFVAFDIYTPVEKADEFLERLYEIGAGRIGNYEKCAYSLSGTGSFMPLEDANPYSGRAYHMEHTREIKFEMVCPAGSLNALVDTINRYHPYEAPVYRITSMKSVCAGVGIGVIGNLTAAVKYADLIEKLKKYFSVLFLRASSFAADGLIERIAFCSGNGASYLEKAKALGAQAYITSDCKSHDFLWAAENGIALVCPTHFASEHQFVALMKKVLDDSEADSLIEISKQSDYEVIV